MIIIKSIDYIQIEKNGMTIILPNNFFSLIKIFKTGIEICKCELIDLIYVTNMLEDNTVLINLIDQGNVSCILFTQEEIIEILNFVKGGNNEI